MTDDSRPQQGDPPATDAPLESPSAAVTPSIDTVFELLADADRRRICLYLIDTEDGVVTVDELVEALAGDDRDRDRLAIDLHHRHLPKLSSAGLVEYDPRSNTTRYWGQPTVEKWAEHVRAVDTHTGQSAP